jgi:major type 1 subunit fimbrin (pilin)
MVDGWLGYKGNSNLISILVWFHYLFPNFIFKINPNLPSIRNLQSAIRNLQSDIRNPTSAIRHPQSDIRNPQSAIRNPTSAIRNPNLPHYQ